MIDFREYENGVADVLAFLAGETAEVQRNVRVLGRRGARARQVDVLVRGRIFGMADATMIVDCKRRKRPLEVNDIESFLGMIDDVGADIGLLVTSSGTTGTAMTRANAERGVRLEILPLDELMRWSPPGTISTTYAVPVARLEEAEATLRSAGHRVRPDQAFEAREGEEIITVFRHYGQASPSAEIQHRHQATAELAFGKLNIDARHVAHGVTTSGGTPAHRWLEITVAGGVTGMKFLAATEAEAEAELDRIATTFGQNGVPREALGYVKPEGWPVTTMFGL